MDETEKRRTADWIVRHAVRDDDRYHRVATGFNDLSIARSVQKMVRRDPYRRSSKPLAQCSNGTVSQIARAEAQRTRKEFLIDLPVQVAFKAQDINLK